MRHHLLLVAVSGFIAAGCSSVTAAAGSPGAAVSLAQISAPFEIQLWPGKAPGSEAWTQKEIDSAIPGRPPTAIVRNVTTPTLTAYLPDPVNATGSAVIVAPGGAWMMLSINSEGHDAAKWLAERGVAAFVLKYRLIETPASDGEFFKQITAEMTRAGTGDPAVALKALMDRAPFSAEDGVQALKVVRSRAVEWGFAPDRVGMLGFSAGGFVTMIAASQTDASLRPDFAAPIYGGDLDATVDVPKVLPPLFLAVANDDTLLAKSTLNLVSRLRSAGHMPAFHLYASGGHGFGMNKQGKASDHWIEEFYWWMGEQGFLKGS